MLWLKGLQSKSTTALDTGYFELHFGKACAPVFMLIVLSQFLASKFSVRLSMFPMLLASTELTVSLKRTSEKSPSCLRTHSCCISQSASQKIGALVSSLSYYMA